MFIPSFTVHVQNNILRKKLEYIVSTGKIEGQMAYGRQR